MKNNKTISLSELYNEIILENEITPLQKLKTCKITNDGKYIVYEGKAYFTKNGMQVPLNEEWTLSDILHTGADIVSAGMDFVIPGSGAVVDILNGISYIIEAQFKPQEERDSLYLMGAITFAFVILPGPLQAIAVPLKRAVKTGVGMTSKVVVQGLKIIGDSLDFLLAGIPSKIAEALKSPLAKNIMGKWGTKISEFIKRFTTRIKELLNKITGKGKTLTVSTVKEADVIIYKQLTDMVAGPVTKELGLSIVKKASHLSTLKTVKTNGMSLILKKFGFRKGSTFNFFGKKQKITQITDDMIEIDGVWQMAGQSANKIKMGTWEFLKKYFLKPSAKLNQTFIPSTTKILIRCLNSDGSVNEYINQLRGIDVNQTSKELELLAKYEGDTGKYAVNNVVISFQRALMLLGKTMRGNDDGKFGPSTKAALESFQNENGLQSSLGRMDKSTAQKLSEVLNNKKPQGKYKYQDIANTLLTYAKS